jgi:SH3-like domain-containing protein
MRRLAAVALTALLAPSSLLAAEFREVAVNAAVLYDGPSARAARLFIVPRATPLEVLSTVGDWIKVRDYAGDVLWIARADLAPARHVVVSRALASVRLAPIDVGELLFQAERGVLLRVVDEPAPPGWLKVAHRDDAMGFVSVLEVWGR